MNDPLFKIGDTVAVPDLLGAGWIVGIFRSIGPESDGYVYEIEEAEIEVKWLVHESEIVGV